MLVVGDGGQESRLSVGLAAAHRPKCVKEPGHEGRPVSKRDLGPAGQIGGQITEVFGSSYRACPLSHRIVDLVSSSLDGVEWCETANSNVVDQVQPLDSVKKLLPFLKTPASDDLLYLEV